MPKPRPGGSPVGKSRQRKRATAPRGEQMSSLQPLATSVYSSLAAEALSCSESREPSGAEDSRMLKQNDLSHNVARNGSGVKLGMDPRPLLPLFRTG